MAKLLRYLLTYYILASLSAGRATAGLSRDSRRYFLSLSASTNFTYSESELRSHSDLNVCDNATWWPLTTVPESSHDFPSPYGTNAGLVISHCGQDLGWLEEEIERLRTCEIGGINVVSLHVYSKCGREIHGLPPWAVVTRMPNVGRNDQIIATHLATTTNPQPLTIFVKDSYYTNKRSEEERGLVDMCRFSNVALKNDIGLGCGMTPRQWITKKGRYASGSAWHVMGKLGEFKMDGYSAFSNGPNGESSQVPFQSPARPLKNWLETSGVLPYSKISQIFTPDETLVPVCYGGQFAVISENTRRVPQEGWAMLAGALSRGDNVEEGHFAERSWGALLTGSPRWENWLPIQERLLRDARIVHSFPLDGMLAGCGPAGPSVVPKNTTIVVQANGITVHP